MAPAREPNFRALALGLAAILLLVLALVGTAPLWAPLLPWDGGNPRIDPAVIERLDAEQHQILSLQQQIATAAAAMPKLEQRVGALEQKPLTIPPEFGEMRQRIDAVSAGISDLTPRLERLTNAVQVQARGIADLTTRVDRTEQERQALIADLGAKVEPLQQSLQTQQSAVAELSDRLQRLEKAARSRAGDTTDIGLTLALLQLRDAVDAGRPFPAEYAALSSLAKARPEIAAAAAPLAAAASTGAATHAKLARELREVGQEIDKTASAGTVSNGGWTGAALDRLRGLVRIRRADEAAPTKEAEAAVTVAERALAEGDLARAVAAVETLQGAAAASVAAWLRQARERLAVEAAMRQLQALLTGRLGDTATIPGAPG
ncbi:MAG: COG4223 family protein [Alphaproteobacteria bacterium]